MMEHRKTCHNSALNCWGREGVIRSKMTFIFNIVLLMNFLNSCICQSDNDMLCLGRQCNRIFCSLDTDCPPYYVCRQDAWSNTGGILFHNIPPIGSGTLLRRPFRGSGGLLGAGASTVEGLVDGIWSTVVPGLRRPLSGLSYPSFCVPVGIKDAGVTLMPGGAKVRMPESAIMPGRPDSNLVEGAEDMPWVESVIPSSSSAAYPSRPQYLVLPDGTVLPYASLVNKLGADFPVPELMRYTDPHVLSLRGPVSMIASGEVDRSFGETDRTGVPHYPVTAKYEGHDSTAHHLSPQNFGTQLPPSLRAVAIDEKMKQPDLTEFDPLAKHVNRGKLDDDDRLLWDALMSMGYIQEEGGVHTHPGGNSAVPIRVMESSSRGGVLAEGAPGFQSFIEVVGRKLGQVQDDPDEPLNADTGVPFSLDELLHQLVRIESKVFDGQSGDADERDIEDGESTTTTHHEEGDNEEGDNPSAKEFLVREVHEDTTTVTPDLDMFSSLENSEPYRQESDDMDHLQNNFEGQTDLNIFNGLTGIQIQCNDLTLQGRINEPMKINLQARSIDHSTLVTDLFTARFRNGLSGGQLLKIQVWELVTQQRLENAMSVICVEENEFILKFVITIKVVQQKRKAIQICDVPGVCMAGAANANPLSFSVGSNQVDSKSMVNAAATDLQSKAIGFLSSFRADSEQRIHGISLNESQSKIECQSMHVDAKVGSMARFQITPDYVESGDITGLAFYLHEKSLFIVNGDAASPFKFKVKVIELNGSNGKPVLGRDATFFCSQQGTFVVNYAIALVDEQRNVDVQTCPATIVCFKNQKPITRCKSPDHPLMKSGNVGEVVSVTAGGLDNELFATVDLDSDPSLVLHVMQDADTMQLLFSLDVYCDKAMNSTRLVKVTPFDSEDAGDSVICGIHTTCRHAMPF